MDALNKSTYRLYRYSSGGRFKLATNIKFDTYSAAWNYYYNNGKHLGPGFYMFVKSTEGKPDEIVSLENVK